jgi:hypothetical protein
MKSLLCKGGTWRIFDDFRIVVSHVDESVKMILEFGRIMDWVTEEYRLGIDCGEMYGDVFDPETATMRKFVELRENGSIVIEDLDITILVLGLNHDKLGQCLLEVTSSALIFSEGTEGGEECGDGSLGTAIIACA